MLNSPPFAGTSHFVLENSDIYQYCHKTGIERKTHCFLLENTRAIYWALQSENSQCGWHTIFSSRKYPIRHDLPLVAEVAVNLLPFWSGNLRSLAASYEGEQRIISNRNYPLNIHSLLKLSWPDMFIHLQLANYIHPKLAEMVRKEFSLANICRFDELDKSADIDTQFLRTSGIPRK